MAIVVQSAPNTTFTFTAGEGFYGFIEIESSSAGGMATFGVWDGRIVFGPSTASPLECTLLLAVPLLLIFAVGVCGVVLWRSHRSSRRRAPLR